jgi:hypothetical protein
MPPELNDDGTPKIEQNEGGTIGTGNQERLDRLSAIADSHERNVEDQFANVNDDDTTSPFQAPKLEAEDGQVDSPPEPIVDPADPASYVAPTPEVKKYKLKVNGKEIELSEEEVLARASKVESADEYLRSAKKQAAPAPEIYTGPTPEELQRHQDEEDKALARALQVGTEEEALAAVRKIREQASARPSFTKDDVFRTIDERLTFKDAITAFRTEYSDIAKDPLLWKLATERDMELLRDGDPRSYAERFTDIGNELRSWVKSMQPVEPPAPPPNLEPSKDEKKATMPRVPTPASRKAAAPAPEDDKEESTAEVIANIAKARGGPQWMRG